MSGEKEPEKPSPDPVNGKDIETSHLPPSLSSHLDATFNGKVIESGLINPGFEGAVLQWEDQPYYVPNERLILSNMGVQSENNSFPYCMPSHITYNSEQPPSQQHYIPSSRFFHQTMPHVSQAVHVISSDSKFGAKELQTKTNNINVSKAKSTCLVTSGSSSKEDRSSVHAETKFAAKASSQSLERTQQRASSSGFSGHYFMSCKAPHLSSGNRPVVNSRGFHYLSKASTPSYYGQGRSVPRNTFYGPRSIYPTANANGFQMSDKPNLCRNHEVSSELVRGPRANRIRTCLNSSLEEDNLSPSVRRDHYNRPDFEVKYEQAKFFMIKSYSEDDIHRSIKYNVWASTPNGNNKLDDAFRKAEMEKMEQGTQCPIFLFFSVNASGQFVGLAEMTGPIDFKKNMDFWQQDKWNGFFPVKWHIIKDIPNRNFQHITLENNDNKAVTFSRDTQEIKLPQGLSMLQMFKAYQSGSSILDDFDFYENREKSLLTTRGSRPESTSSYVDSVDDISLNYLESKFENMSTSSRARRPHIASNNAPTYFG